MKNMIKTLMVAAAGLLGVAQAHAVSTTVFSEFGVRVTASAGTVVLNPLFHATAVAAAGYGPAWSSAADGVVDIPAGSGFTTVAQANSNFAEAITDQAPDELYVASTSIFDFDVGGQGMAASLASIYFSLSVIDVTGWVTVTIEPIYETLWIDDSNSEGRIASAGSEVSLVFDGIYSYLNNVTYPQTSGAAGFGGTTFDVQAGEEVQGSITAQTQVISVPDTASTLALGALAGLGLWAARRRSLR